MPNILSRKVTKILLARFARSLIVYRRASHKSRNFAIIILLSEKREISEMILRERGGEGRGGGSSIMLLGTCGSYGWQNNTWRRWWKIYCAPLACKPPPPPNFKTWIRLWWLRCRWLLTPRTAPKSNFQQSSVVALNQAAPIPFLPGAGDIYVCADYFVLPQERRRNDLLLLLWIKRRRFHIFQE